MSYLRVLEVFLGSKQLLLFDVDSTLISAGGAGLRALEAAFEEVYGLVGALQDYSLAGRTDNGILSEVLAENDLVFREEGLVFKERYLGYLRQNIGAPDSMAVILPGVERLLDCLRSEANVVLALLTGNWREGAKIKLERFGLWSHFEFGAFAEDGQGRNDLGPVAISRFLGREGEPPSRVIVIGDTPMDVACGKWCGAETLAVATGPYSFEVLFKEKPSWTLPDLSETEELMRIFKGSQS
jgi:phosphoglycolate phosphatase-like HAD superfamily hydrolase